MYTKPTLEKFGTFRELTQIGWYSNSDGYIICGIGTGNNLGDYNPTSS